MEAQGAVLKLSGGLSLQFIVFTSTKSAYSTAVCKEVISIANIRWENVDL